MSPTFIRNEVSTLIISTELHASYSTAPQVSLVINCSLNFPPLSLPPPLSTHLLLVYVSVAFTINYESVSVSQRDRERGGGGGVRACMHSY